MRAHELRGNGLETLTMVERESPRFGPGQVLVWQCQVNGRSYQSDDCSCHGSPPEISR